jgi:hypothetical protein
MSGRAPIIILVLVAGVLVTGMIASSFATGKTEKGQACVLCHTTGNGDGGYTSAEATPKLLNVGCESCHGAGGTHVKTMLTAMMDETEVTDKHISRSVSCVKCHNPHISYKKIYGE